MNRADAFRIGALYLPIVAALLAGLARRPGRRLLAGCLLSTLWTATALVVLAKLNQRAGWWSFAAGDIEFCGMPLEFYLGWAVLWGRAPQLLFRRLPLVWVA